MDGLRKSAIKVLGTIMSFPHHFKDCIIRPGFTPTDIIFNNIQEGEFTEKVFFFFFFFFFFIFGTSTSTILNL